VTKNKYKTKAHLYHYSPGRLVIFIIADHDDRLGLDELALLARLVTDLVISPLARLWHGPGQLKPGHLPDGV
jgi:hypothetical protein